MREVQRTVFYCDFCGKHGLRRASLLRHEEGCTLNPDRGCGWCKCEAEDFNVAALAAQVALRDPLNTSDIEWVRRECDGCPACMLAALRQSGVEYLFDMQAGRIFDYDQEVARFREEERIQEQYDEMHAIESTWI